MIERFPFLIPAVCATAVALTLYHYLRRGRSRIAQLDALSSAILGSVNHMVIAVDLNGTIISFNTTAENILGYTAAEVIGKATPSLFHDHDEMTKRAADLSAELGRQVEPGLDAFTLKPRELGSETREWTFISKDGTRKPFNLTVSPLFNSAKEITGFLGVILDASASKAVEQALYSSEERMRTILEAAPNGILTVDARGIIQSANATMFKIFGYTEAELLGKPITTLIPHSFHARHDKDVANFMESGQRRQMAAGKDVVGLRKDGGIVPVEVGLSRTVLPGGEPSIIATVQDISIRKLQESQKEQLLERLTASNTELERFAYITSHDMQEPIRMITNFSEIIMKDYGSQIDPTGREYLSLVISSSTRLKDLVDDLLAYSRVGNQNLAMTKFEGQMLIDNILENLKNMIAENKAEVTFEKLPQLYGNPIQVTRLLQNLIVNAIKYQPKGNLAKIHISFSDTTDAWHIAVTDNGIGIKEEFIEQIFLPFRRLHTWDAIQGTGLGLSICRKIAETHAGKLWAQSTPGQGSTFTFTLKKPDTNAMEAA